MMDQYEPGKVIWSKVAPSTICAKKSHDEPRKTMHMCHDEHAYDEPFAPMNSYMHVHALN